MEKKRFIFLRLISVWSLGLVVVEVKVHLLCNFWWKRKFYCSVYSFVLGCWWKSKGSFFDIWFSFEVCGGWSKGSSFTWFWWKMKFYYSFYSFVLGCWWKSKGLFFDVWFPFGVWVCGGWSKGSSFRGFVEKGRHFLWFDDLVFCWWMIFVKGLGLWCLNLFVSSMYGVVCSSDLVAKASNKVCLD